MQTALLRPRLVLAEEEFLESVTAGARRTGSTLLPLTGLEARGQSLWAGRSAGAESAAVTPSSHAVISFTSGSTGVPKGAVITHEGLVSAAGAYVDAMGTSEDDRTLVMVPLFHNTGFCDQLAHMLLVGGAVDLLPAFGVAVAREALLRQPSTFLMGVPGILRLLATGEHGRRDLLGLPDRVLRRLADARGLDRAHRLALARAPALQLIRPHGVHVGQPSASTLATWPITPAPSAGRCPAHSSGSSPRTARNCRPARSGASGSQGRAA